MHWVVALLIFLLLLQKKIQSVNIKNGLPGNSLYPLRVRPIHLVVALNEWSFSLWALVCGGFPALPHHVADQVVKLSVSCRYTHETCTRGLIHKGWQSWRANLICCLYLMPLDARWKHNFPMSIVQAPGWKRCCRRNNWYEILIEVTTLSISWMISRRSWLFLHDFGWNMNLSYSREKLRFYDSFFTK